jgi:uncharacterized small protein (DUF1192 family)
MDDEEPILIKSAFGLGQSMDGLSVGELEAYIKELETEIDRARAAIKARQDVRSAADALFKRST